MCKLSFMLFTGYQPRSEQFKNCQLSVTTSAPTHPLPISDLPFQAASFFCRHAILCIPLLRLKPSAKALISYHVLKQWNYLPSDICHKTPPSDNIIFLRIVFLLLPPPPPTPCVCTCVCVSMHACVYACVRACVRVCVCVRNKYNIMWI